MRYLTIVLGGIILSIAGLYWWTNSEKEPTTVLLIEGKVGNTTREIIGDYTDAITLSGVVNNEIKSTTWKTSDERLPILLQLISPQGEVETVFSSSTKGETIFYFPSNTLCSKNGYLLKISDQLKHVLVKSRLIVVDCGIVR